MKKIYQPATEDEAMLALDQFAERWDDKYPKISESWRSYRHNLDTLFSYPVDIRQAVKKRKLFPGRFRDEGQGDLPGDPGDVEKMEHADP